MPVMQKPGKFPGMDSLPSPIRGLAESIFPQDSEQIPVPAMTTIPNPAAAALGGVQVPHDKATMEMLMEAFRPKPGIAKAMPAEMNVSQVEPDFGYRKIVGSALDDYRKVIAGLLGGGKP